MCTPALTMAVMGGGTAMAAVGSYNQANAQKDAYGYQAQVDQNNVTIANEQRSQALNVGEREEQASDLKTAQTFGQQRAAMASNGVDLSASGSAQDILATTKYMGGVDALTIHDNALRQAWGYSVEATNAQNSANFMNTAAKNINPASSAFSSLVGGGAQVASKWYDYNKQGVDVLG